MGLNYVLLMSFLLYHRVESGPSNKDDLKHEEMARKFVVEAERQMHEAAEEYVYANWNYQTNITQETTKIARKLYYKNADLVNVMGKEAQKYDIREGFKNISSVT